MCRCSDALDNRRRARRRATNNPEPGAEEPARPAPQVEFVNNAFEADDADEQRTVVEDLDAQGNRNAKSAISTRHRDRSRDLATKIQEEDPNEVIQDLHIVRDKIKEKITEGLAGQIALIREGKLSRDEDEEEEDEVGGKKGLNLESTSSTLVERRIQSRLSATDSSLKGSTTLSRLRKIQVR